MASGRHWLWVVGILPLEGCALQRLVSMPLDWLPVPQAASSQLGEEEDTGIESPMVYNPATRNPENGN